MFFSTAKSDVGLMKMKSNVSNLIEKSFSHFFSLKMVYAVPWNSQGEFVKQFSSSKSKLATLKLLIQELRRNGGVSLMPFSVSQKIASKMPFRASSWHTYLDWQDSYGKWLLV